MSTSTDEEVIRVAIAGPTGRLGPHVLKAFLLSTTPKFHITLLTRSTSVDKTTDLIQSLTSENPSSTNLSSGSNIVQSTIPLSPENYTSSTYLTPLLTNHDAVIDLINRYHADESIALIDASFAAGVKHFIPSSFGVGTRHAYLRGLPPLREKVRMEDHLFGLAEGKNSDGNGGNGDNGNDGDNGNGAQSIPPPRTTMTYTSLNTGGFLEYALSIGLLFNTSPSIMAGASMVPNGGAIPFTLTSYSDISHAVLRAVTLGVAHDERVLNKILNIQTFSTTHNEILEMVRGIRTDREWTVIDVDTKEAERESIRILEQEEKEDGHGTKETSAQAARGFMLHGSFGLGLGDLGQEQVRVGNEVLGIQGWGREEVRRWLEGILKE